MKYGRLTGSFYHDHVPVWRGGREREREREREGTMLSYTKCGHLSPDESTVAHLHGFVINKYF